MFYEKINDKWQNVSPESRKRWEKISWVALEKIHGANFSIHIEKQETNLKTHQKNDVDANFEANFDIKFAKRKTFLQWEDDFFGYQSLVNSLSVQAINFFGVLEKDFLVKKVIIYGELCGGEYPHPDIKPFANVQAIQKGVYYCPDIRFFAFDVRIFTTENKVFYLDFEDFFKYMQKTAFFCVPHFTIDKLKAVLEFDIEINSPIPSLLGLPALPFSNKIEGIIIKPTQHSLLGEETAENPRPVFKIKRKEFLENPAYQEALRWESLDKNNDWADIDFWTKEISAYLSYNRLQNTISKLGNTQTNTPQNLQIRATEWANDALDSFILDYPELWYEIKIEMKNEVKNRLIFEAIKKIA